MGKPVEANGMTVMAMLRACRRMCVWIALFGLAAPAWAEFAEQEIRLQPGWNAVYFEIEPEDNACESVFAGIPVESVWQWNKRFSSVQFVRDPDELRPEEPEWLTYFPESSPNAFMKDLYAVQSGQAYLIKLGGTQPVTLRIVGTAVIRSPRWNADSFNLVGFPTDPASPPTFKSFFDPDPALRDQAVYRMGSDGSWERVTSPTTQRMNRGSAYWVYCKGDSSYGGPLSVTSDTGELINFGERLNEQVVGLVNHSDGPKTVTLTLRPPSAAQVKSRSGGTKSLRGEVALSYQRLLSWTPLSEPLTVTVKPRSSLGVRLAVRRADMLPATGPDTNYGGVLEIRDSAGVLQKVGVTAKKDDSNTGLWVGSVVVDRVSEAGNPQDSATPQPTSSEFTFRLIVHVDRDGNAKLLQQVYVMQVEEPAPKQTIDFTEFLPDEPPKYVLVTDDNLLDQFDGVHLRDGEVIGRRISTPVFSFAAPVAMTGNLDTQLALASPLVLDYDDPLNPFVHRFHPDHDNLDERYENMLPEGEESFAVTRNITLQFSSTDPQGLGLPEWGYNLVGGTYKESFVGLHKRTIRVEGQFQLTRVSKVDVLNDGL